MLPNVNSFMSEYMPPSHQKDWPEPTAFDKLRIKTEMQLVKLINIELNLGIQDACQALTSADTGPVREKRERRANSAYAKATRLISVVAEITAEERNRIQARLEHLQRMLKALSTITSTPVPADDEISALARAVWEAKGCPEGFAQEDWFRAERALKTQMESNFACFAS
jgi:hypothetical protein